MRRWTAAGHICLVARVTVAQLWTNRAIPLFSRDKGNYQGLGEVRSMQLTHFLMSPVLMESVKPGQSCLRSGTGSGLRTDLPQVGGDS